MVSANPRVTSEILTIMFIDIVGYTKVTSNLNRDLFNEMHDVFDSISLPLFQKYSGNVLKKMGDAFLITFKSPTDAVLCGMELQDAFDRYNASRKGKYPLKIRVAIHTGEVLLRGGDVYGDAVNITSRLENVAGPGEIVFSEALFMAMNKNEVPYVHLGVKKLRGTKYPVRVFRVKGHYDKILRRKKIVKQRMRRVKRFFLMLTLFMFLGIMIALALWYVWVNTDLLKGLL